MSIQGSDDLNMLLKAKVVKLRVELDYKNSNLSKQVSSISRYLEDKPVKLKVKLNSTVKELNAEINSIEAKIKNSKGVQPIKLQVQIDVAGSAKNIKEQLKGVYKTVQDFNKQYGQQIKQMQKTMSNSATSGKGLNPFGSVDPATYVNSLRQAEKYMKNSFGKGLFSSTEMKNANGEMMGFIGSLTKANGVVQKIKYEWNKDKGAFTPISQTTVTETEKNVARAKQALQALYVEIEKLKTGSGKSNLLSQYSDLEKRASHMTLNGGNVADLQRQIKEEGVLQQQIRQDNALYQEQQKLIARIVNERSKMKNDTSARTITSDMSKLEANLGKLNLNDNMAKNMINEIKSQFGALKSQYQEQLKYKQDLRNADEKRLEVLHQLDQMEKTIKLDSNGTGFTGKAFISDTKILAQNIKSMEDYIAVKRRMDLINRESSGLKVDANLTNKLKELEVVMKDFATKTGLSQQTIEDRFAQVSHHVKDNVTLINEEITRYRELMRIKQTDIELEARRNSIVGSSDRIKSMISAKDTEGVKQYIASLYGADVAMLRLQTDAKGITRISAQLESTGKTAREVSLELSNMDRELRQVGDRDVFNANRNLGIFEQLRVAMARVPVWMVAMTAFYGTLHIIKDMTSEVLQLDQALTEIRRVASSNISIDSLFKDAVGLSKELGNNTHDVLASVGEMARTFGNFNERQLIAITRTATLMSNVSDLTAQEASNNLVGTMNAFNISAEESIHIVDALNEVDNNYAVSTKQLSEGLSKTASTAKTFGVGMEEVVGHITAIGAVTMESGAIIGNSLKTIYSRLTTVKEAKKSLLSIGVALTESNGEARSAEKILGDVASRWGDMTNAQKQSLSVQVAGRYQLSRFLALMNNWGMSVDATKTAVNSQGSAMRENAKYMQSFQARINQLKDGFTELSSAVGDSILSDGLFSAIELLKKFAEAGIWVAKNFGALPAVLIPVVMVLGKMGILESIVISLGKMKMLSSTIGLWKTFTGTISRFNTVQRETMAVTAGTATRTQAIASAWRSVTVSTAGATVGMRAFAMAMKSALITTGIGILIVGLGFAIEKLTHYMAEQKRKAEELQKMNDKMVASYRQHRDGMTEMINRYDELSQKQLKSKSEEEEYLKLQKDLANQLPTTVSYIDANGVAHMKTMDAIRNEVQQVKELSKANADLKTAKFNENLDKQATSYQKIVDKIKDLKNKQDDLIASNGSTRLVHQGLGEDASIKIEKRDNTTEIQKNKVETLIAEAQKTEALKGTIKAIQSQSLAWLESNNMMANLTDAQQSAVETFVSQNESIIRNAKDFKQAYAGLFEIGNQIGTTFSDAMDKYKSSLSDSDPSKQMKLDQFKTQLDGVSKSIPQYFYQLTDANGNVTKSSDDVINGLKEIVNVSHVVGTSSANDTNQLVYRLERAGLSAEDAQGYLYKLSNENNNLAIKSVLASQGIDEQTGSMQNLNEETAKAVDLTKEVIGYSNDELEALKTRLTVMQVLVQTNGENAKGTQKYIDLQKAVADQLGITTDELEQHKEKYFAVADAIEKIDWTKLKPNMNFNKFIDDQLKGYTSKTKEIVKNALTKDVFDGTKTDFSKQLKENIEAPIVKMTNNVKDIFTNLNFKMPEVDWTRTKASLFYVEDNVGKLQGKLKDLGVDLNTPTGNAMIDGMIGHLEKSDGKIKDSKNNILLLRGIINAGIGAGMFGNVGKNADTAKDKIKNTTDAVKTLKTTTQAPFNPNLNPLLTGLDKAKKKAGETGGAWSVTSNAFNKPIKVSGKPMQDLDQMIKGVGASADTTKGKTDSVVSAGSQVSKVNSDLHIVLQQSDNVDKHLNNLNKTLGKLGDGFSSGKVRSELGKIGSRADDVKNKINGMNNILSNINSGSTKGVGDLLQQLGLLSGSFNLVTRYGKTTVKEQKNIVDSFSRVAGTAKAYNNALSSAGKDAGKNFNSMASAINGAVSKILKSYLRNIGGLDLMVKSTASSLNTMNIDIDKASHKASVKIQSMTSAMHKAFKDGMKGIVSSAGTLPQQIGDAVRKNMSDATGSMDALAKDMVKRFKSELGIHSPSRVFTKLGGHIIEGLVNGLNGGNLKELGKSVFNDFGGGIYDSIDTIKSYLSGGDLGGSGSGSKAVKSWLMSAIGETGVSPNWLEPLYQMAMKESGGNPKAINNWDSNAKAGHPSKGLLQTIDSTFSSYAMGGHGNIYNPIDNAIASIRYILARYGSIFNTPGMKSMSNGRGYRGYANGGIIDKMELAWHGEEGAEAIIPLVSNRRQRGLQLWEQTGQKLGIDPSVIEWLKQNITNKPSTSGTASSDGGSFGATSGEGGVSGGGDSGASGTIIPSTPSYIISGGRDLSGQYIFTALADRYSDYVSSSSSSSSSSSKKKKKKPPVKKKKTQEDLAEAFSFDKYEREAQAIDSYIKILEARLGSLAKSGIKYRDTLKSIITEQGKHLSVEKQDLSVLQKRQSSIESQLKKLPSVGRQNKAQRDSYNKLMQEYDGNIGKIQSLKQNIESEIDDIKTKSLEVFTNFIDEVTSNYDKAINAIQTKVDNTDFKIQVLTFTNPDDMKSMLNAQVEKANELQSQQATAYNKQQNLQKQYDSVKKDPDKSAKVKEELDKATKDYQQYTLAVLQAEKDVKDTRGKIADDAINQLKDYYGKMKEMATDAIDKEKAELQKAHDIKMKMYDDETKSVNDFYDNKFAQMEKDKAEGDYQTQLAEKNATRNGLINKIALLSNDGSIEGKKKLADLQQQLVTANKDLSDLQKQHQQDALKQSLEDQKKAQLDSIQSNKDTEQKQFDDTNTVLDAEKDAVTKKYDELINNDKKWADARNEAIKGNFSTIQTELKGMTDNINLMNSGVFDNLTTSLTTFSDAVKKQIIDANAMIVDNLNFNSTEPVNNVTEATKSSKYTPKDGKVDTGKATHVSTPNQTTPSHKTTKPPSSSGSSGSTEYYTVKSGDNFWDLENKFKLSHGTLAKLNPSISPSNLKIGQRIVIKKGSSSSSSHTSTPSSSSSSNDYKTTSALNLRSSASYNGSVMMTIPKGAGVDYQGMVDGWAKVKYKGKTGYVGKSYLQKFDTGGFTGDWTGSDGKLAVLHKKELVLNEHQTGNILDTAKIMDKITNLLPAMKRNLVADKFASENASINTNITYGDINVTVENGDKKKSKDIAKEIITGFKKMGKGR